MSATTSPSPNVHSDRIRGEEVPRRLVEESRGVAATSLEGNDVPHSTARLRFVVRMWMFMARWTERRLVAAYDRLVDHESDWSS